MELDAMSCIAIANKWSPLTCFLLFNILMSCVIIILIVISLPRDFKIARVLSIFAQHQNSRLADMQSPGWWPRLKSFLHRQTSRAASPIASSHSLSPQCRLNRGNWVSAASRVVSSTRLVGRVPHRVCQLLGSTSFIWIPTILRATVSPHLARRGRQHSRFSDSQLKRICGI